MSIEPTTQSNVPATLRGAGINHILQLLSQVEASLRLPDALPKEERKRSHSATSRLSAPAVDRVATIAEQHDGVLGGYQIDPAELRDAITYEAMMDPIVIVCDRISRGIRDEALRRQHGAAMKASLAIAAMKRLGTLRGLVAESDLRAIRATTPRRRKATVDAVTPPATPVATPK